MSTEKRLGIWMDHSNAHVMEFTTDIKTNIIEAEFSVNDKEQNLGRNENLLHNKEQHEQTAFYKKLIEVIKNFKEVLLFGPTNAKVELFNLLRDNHLFASIKIDVRQAGKLTENQEHAFVRDHFAPHSFHQHKV